MIAFSDGAFSNIGMCVDLVYSWNCQLNNINQCLKLICDMKSNGNNGISDIHG